MSIDRQIGFIDSAGQIVIEPQFSHIRQATDGMLAVSISYPSGVAGHCEEKWGFVDEQGKYAVEPRYERVEGFSEGLAAVKCDNGLQGFVDVKGRMVVPPQYYDTRSYSEGVAWVKRDGCLWELIDSTGATVVPASYDLIQYTLNCWFKEGLCYMSDGPSGGPGPASPQHFIDATGRAVLKDAGITKAAHFDGGACFVRRADGKWVLIDKAGRVLSDRSYGSCATVTSDLSTIAYWTGVVEQVELAAIRSGIEMTVDAECVTTFVEGLALVERGDLWGYLSREGREAIAPTFEEAYPFCGTLARVKQNGKYGYIGKTGRFTIKPQYEDASDFHDGFAYVKIAGKYGYVDTAGRIAIAPRFSEVDVFACGLAPILVGDRWGYIDRHGRSVWKPSI